MIRVLFVDDNVELCSVFQLYLEETNKFLVTICYSATDALEYLQKNHTDVIISDYNMPGMNGIDLLRQIQQSNRSIPFILFTGDDTKETAIQALNAGADFYQEKEDDIEIQIIALSNKIQILYDKKKAEEAIIRKDAILECISYAADRFLRGSMWDEEIEEILYRFGETLKIQHAYIIRIQYTEESKIPIMYVQYDWKEKYTSSGEDKQHNPIIDYIRSCPEVYEQLIQGNPVTGTIGTGNKKIWSFLHKNGIISFILAPIISNNVLWGCIGLEDKYLEHIWTEEEVKAIRLATQVFGSAKYRIEIEEMFRNPIEQGLVGIFVIQDGSFIYINPRFSQIFGYDREAMLTHHPGDFFHQDDREIIQSTFNNLISHAETSFHLEFRGITKSGSIVYCELFLSCIYLQGKPAVIGTLIDISARKSAEQALLESEYKFREIFNNSNDMIFLYTVPTNEKPGRILEVNQVVLDSLRYSRDIILKMTFSDICPDYSGIDNSSYGSNPLDNERLTFETEFHTCASLVIPVEVSSHRFNFNGMPVMLSVARNISDRKVAEAKLRMSEETLKKNILASLYEKETLLREIHHRVKNNMQIIMSILKLQDYRVDEERIHGVIRDCRNRISSMAVIHEKLYMTESFSKIIVGDYLRELADRIIREFYPLGDRTNCTFSCDPDICVDIEKGIPLGLIINELITNSMKYAFIGKDNGVITITIEKKESIISILYCDNGIGLPDNFNLEASKTLGIQLIQNLTFQLQGTISSESDKTGTRYHLQFPMQ